MKGPLRTHRGGTAVVGKVPQGRLSTTMDRRFLGGKKLTNEQIDNLISKITNV